jgi:hypothetical protein
LARRLARGRLRPGASPRGPESGVLAPLCHHPPDLLSRRENGNTALNTVSDDDENGWASFRDTSLDTYEALKLLPLGEVVSRKAHDSQLIGIRAALRGGASWEQIAEALGVPPDFARKFNEAIAERLDADAAAAARDLAGARPVP